MKKIANFLIDRRYYVLAFILALSVICGVLTLQTPINKDRSQYLSDDSQMKEGMGIMGSAFPEMEEKASIRVMFDNLTPEQIIEVKAALQAIPNVSSVTYDPESPDHNKDNHTLFIVNSKYDYFTDEEKAIEKAIETGFSQYQMIYQNNDLPATRVPIWLLATAVLMAAVILVLMSPSFLDPILFLVTLAFAAVINFGTNFMLPYIDEMTATVGPILQMVLSMDYSIILITRYRQEKQRHESKLDAMKTALAGSISSIASSSLTTMVGLLALVFLSFKLGPEMGIVLAKGVVIGMLCVFTVLPTFILLMDPLLEKTKKKSLHLKMDGVANISFKCKRIMPLLFVVLLIGSYILQGFTTITFTEKSEDPLIEIFPKDNQLVLIYKTQDEGAMKTIIAEIEKDENIKSVMGYANTLGKEMTPNEMVQAMAELGDAALDETVVKMLYFMAQDGELPTLTLSQLLTFIAEDVITHPFFAEQLDPAMIENATTLEKIADKETLALEMTSEEMSDFLGIGQAEIEQLYLYYGIQKGVEDSGTMTLSTFVDFLLNTVAEDEIYGEMLDPEMRSSLSQLSLFTNKEELAKQRTAAELATLFSLDENLIIKPILFFQQKETMSLEEFVNTIESSSLITGVMDQEKKEQIALLKRVISATKNDTAFTSEELSLLFGMTPAQAEQLYLLYLYETDAMHWSITPADFVAFMVSDVVTNPDFATMIDPSMTKQLETVHTVIRSVMAETPYTAEETATLFGSIAPDFEVEQIRLLYCLYAGVTETAERTMSVVALFDFLCDHLLQNETYAHLIDQNTKDLLLENRPVLTDAIAQLQGETYSRLVITSTYPDESPESLVYVDSLHKLCQTHLSEYYLIGSSVMVHEIDQTFRQEYLMITLITAVAIFLVVLCAFRNPTLPLLLTLLVQCGVFITVAVIGAYSGAIYYLALLVVQSILMGATIDYGIVFCHFYKENRPKMGVFEAIKAGYEGSIHTIMTSGTILVVVLAALGIFATSVTISEVCVTLSIGSFVAILLILFVLPGMVACFDKLIYRQKKEKTEEPLPLLPANPTAEEAILLCYEEGDCGREVGKKVASALGVPVYDMDVLQNILAETLGEKQPTAEEPEKDTFLAEEILLKLAKKEPCVLLSSMPDLLCLSLPQSLSVVLWHSKDWQSKTLAQTQAHPCHLCLDTGKLGADRCVDIIIRSSQSCE